MSEEFEINEGQITFDFKGFLHRLLRNWPLFVISLAIGFSIAYYINVRKLPVYQMENLVSIRDDQNPFFTTNTSLVFNWGGTTDKVNTAVVTLRSRSHNEKVVERLQYYLTYLKDGKYQKVDAYKQTPFFIAVDTSKSQMLNHELKVVFKDSVNFTLSVAFEESKNIALQNYSNRDIERQFVEIGDFSKDFRIGQTINTPFFNGEFLPNPNMISRPGTPYYIVFREYDSAVKSFLNVGITPESKGSSVLRMRAVGDNKAKLVDYLNTSVQVLSEDMLARKNLFATKTIDFIDSSLAEKSVELSLVEDELNKFREKNAIYDLSIEGATLNTKLNGLDLRKEAATQQLDYFNILEDYLLTRSDYRDVPAPSVAGIEESSIATGVGRIVSLAEERNKHQYTFKEDAPIFSDIDRQIDAVKSVLLENIRSSKSLKNKEIADINRDIAQYESEIRKLPKEQQDLLKIERRYNLSQGTYNLFLSKRSEAGLVKAANVSDVLVIDSAKDTGGGQIGPNTQLNYVMAGMLGLFIPVLLVFVRVFFDTKIDNVKDIEKITSIPLIGVIGQNHSETLLAVFHMPKSALAEAFRSLRSSLQFLYKQQGITGSKIVLLTSSVSGEGKTFCSINLATIFALSKKKTVIVDLDLRRPKIALTFNLDNSIGAANFLINEASLDAIVQKTETPFLDVIPSGPTPPNPSELLMGDGLHKMIQELKENYDYIVIDSPPMGLVSDSLELSKHADATLYLVRQKYTHKNMLTFVNDKYRRGEVEHISILFNDYVEKTGKGYGYGYGYGYYDEDHQKKGFWKRVMGK